MHRSSSILVALMCGASAVPLVANASGEPNSAVTSLSPIVVTATRTPQSSYDLPASISTVNKQQLQEALPKVNLSESLKRVPGLVVQNRQNYATGLQISSRGFGARSPFGVRGLRMLVDGIPATMPDGSTDSEVFDLGSAQRIEVLRGPFSALYGNASGGVIQMFTENGPRQPTVTPNFWAGSYGSYRAGIKLGGQQGRLNDLVDISHFHTGGYRDHSTTRRNQLNGKFRYKLDSRTSATVLMDALSQQAQDPLGLTQTQYEQNPQQAVSQAYQYNTRKTLHHWQTGLVIKHRFSAKNSIRVLGYGGQHNVLQFLPFSGSFGLSSGGVVDLHENFGGTDMRWIHHAQLFSGPLTWVAGVNYGVMDELRKGYVNNQGIEGALRRNENDKVYNLDEYLQGQWQFSHRWSLTMGVRRSQVHFHSTDYFITSSNPNDSGSVTYTHTSPVFGILFKLRRNVHLYANFGEGFETPTFAQLAYKSTGGSGLNFGLKPATSRNYEIGIKSFPTFSTEVQLAGFHIHTSNEIVVAQSVGGRTSYRNDGGTNRNGVELSVDSHLPHHLDAYLAYSYLHARFQGGSVAGNQLPGAPQSTLYAEIRWHDPTTGFYTRLEGFLRSRVYVNDQNTAAASGYGVVNWAGGVKQSVSGLKLDEFVRVANLLGQNYVGAVVIADHNGRYFEPAPGRNFMVGITASYRF